MNKNIINYYIIKMKNKYLYISFVAVIIFVAFFAIHNSANACGTYNPCNTNIGYIPAQSYIHYEGTNYYNPCNNCGYIPAQSYAYYPSVNYYSCTTCYTTTYTTTGSGYNYNNYQNNLYNRGGYYYSEPVNYYTNNGYNGGYYYANSQYNNNYGYNGGYYYSNNYTYGYPSYYY